jgi:organic hydroperoxide reductase OsmC/OhrA
MTTFMVLARKSGLEVGEYRSRAEGVLEKTKEGITFTRIALQVSILAPASRLEEARRLVETAKKHCIVSNSLKLPVEVEATVGPAAETARNL